MIPSPPVNQCYRISFCWVAARHRQARIHTLNSQPAAFANTPRNPQRAHSHQLAHTECMAKSSLHAPLSQLAPAERVPKSP
jgi:hypothetical protein